MAARENQGYLIAIIVLSVICIGLTLGTVFGWSKASAYSDSKAVAEATLKGTEERLKLEMAICQAHKIKADILATMIGSGGSIAEVEPMLDLFDRLARRVDAGDKRRVDAVATSLKKVMAIYDTDMKRGSSTGAADALEPTYKNLITNLNLILAKNENELIVKMKENQMYRVESDAKIQQAKAENDAMAKTLQKMKERLEETEKD